MGTRFEDLKNVELTTVGVKFNIDDPSGDFTEELDVVRRWIEYCADYHDNHVPEHTTNFGLGNPDKLVPEKGLKNEILRLVCGIHTDGKTKQPHIHVHALVYGTPEWKKGWRRDNVERSFKKKNKIPKMSVKIDTAEADQPSKENLLSYVFKEGKPIGREFWIGVDKQDELVLTTFGRNIFEAKQKNEEYQEEQREKEKKKLDNLLDFFKERRDEFDSLRTMSKVWGDYRRELKSDGILTIHDQPNYRIIEADIKKCADLIGVWAFEDGFTY